MRLTDQLKTYLTGIKIKNYEDITTDLKQYSDLKMKIWVSPHSSYAIYNAVTDKVNLVLFVILCAK